MSRASQRLRRIFERRYHGAVVLLTLAVSMTFGASVYISSLEAHRAEALITVTEQRALSQRIGFIIKAIDGAETLIQAEQLRQELAFTVSKMRKAHDLLSSPSSESAHLNRFLDPLRNIYHNQHAPFDHQVRLFLEHAESLTLIPPIGPEWAAAALRRDRVASAAADSMMQTHGLMVRILESNAEKGVRFAIIVDTLLWLSALGLLGFVTFVIFRPMRDEISRAFEEVEGAKSMAKKAEDEAVAANAAKGHFLQAASHELRTPLNAILGMADTINDQAEDKFADEVAQMSAAGDHLLSLLNNILDAHRMNKGSLALEDTTYKLAETISRAVHLGEHLTHDKGLAFEADVDLPQNLEAIGDPARVEQVLANLLDNAAKFTNRGKVSLDANLEVQGKDDTLLNISVSDTGVGIPESRLDAIFNKFSAEGSMLSRNGGLGVGLALTKELLNMMGGSIDV
ncbi:MAG: ATP-binding protein, partial [Pseudomonadota bacterium]